MENENDIKIYKKEYRENLEANNKKLQYLFNQCPNAWFKQLRYNKKIEYFIEYFLPKTYYKENLNKKIVEAMSTISSSELKTTNEHSELFQEFVKNVENEIKTNKCFENKNIFKNMIKKDTEQKQQLERQQLEKNLKSDRSTGYNFVRKFNISQLYNLTDKTFVTQLIQKLKNIAPKIQDYRSTISGLEQELQKNNNKIPVNKICDTISRIYRDYEIVVKNNKDYEIAVKNNKDYEIVVKNNKDYEIAVKNNKKAEVIYNQILSLVTITCDKNVSDKITELPYAKKEAFLNGECLTDFGKMKYNRKTGDFIFYKNKSIKNAEYYKILDKLKTLQQEYLQTQDKRKKQEINEQCNSLSKETINNYEKQGKKVGNFKF